jgi:hypothetical protein
VVCSRWINKFPRVVNQREPTPNENDEHGPQPNENDENDELIPQANETNEYIDFNNNDEIIDIYDVPVNVRIIHVHFPTDDDVSDDDDEFEIEIDETDEINPEVHIYIAPDMKLTNLMTNPELKLTLMKMIEE